MRNTKHGPKCDCVRCDPLQDLREEKPFYKLHCALWASERDPHFVSRRFSSINDILEKYINGSWTVSEDHVWQTYLTGFWTLIKDDERNNVQFKVSCVVKWMYFVIL